MRFTCKLTIPLLVAALMMMIAFMILPINVRADNFPSNLPQHLELSMIPTVLNGTDVSLGSGSTPEVAVNGTFIAVVFENGSGKVALRAGTTIFAPAAQVDSRDGRLPKIAFEPGPITNVVHLVWAGADSSDNPKKHIRYTRCTLSETQAPTCLAATGLATSTTGTRTLENPDIVVDNSRDVHVAWFDRDISGSRQIKTRHCDNCINTNSWDAEIPVPLPGGYPNTDIHIGEGELALATNGSSKVHLAFTDQTAADEWRVLYYNTATNANHTWGIQRQFLSGGADVNPIYGDMNSPALAAQGSNVYLTWDNALDTTPEKFGLTGVSGSNNGSSWGTVQHITSTNSAGVTSATSDQKLSKAANSAVPSQEEKLRPSVAVDGSGKFAVAWQQRPEPNCYQIPEGGTEPENSTSEIYYTPEAGNASASWGVLEDNVDQYSIDPDIAIDGSNKTHIVYMRAPDTNHDCGTTDVTYTIYYRGTITSTLSSGDIYLPIVIKNS